MNKRKAMPQGILWEIEFFAIRVNRKGKVDLLDYDEALLHAQNIQEKFAWNPSAPRSKIAKDLFESIQEYLPPDVAANLELYCAIGTSCDVHHGVDGFFKLGNVYATFDLTTWEEAGNLDADILLLTGLR